MLYDMLYDNLLHKEVKRFFNNTKHILSNYSWKYKKLHTQYKLMSMSFKEEYNILYLFYNEQNPSSKGYSRKQFKKKLKTDIKDLTYKMFEKYINNEQFKVAYSLLAFTNVSFKVHVIINGEYIYKTIFILSSITTNNFNINTMTNKLEMLWA